MILDQIRKFQMAIRQKIKLHLTPERDVAILFFLWKWKVTTTKAVAARFFYDSNPRNAYKRLVELANAGFIESRADITGHKFVWLLTKRGFDVILPNLPPLREEGFGSEHIGHDLLSSAVLLGEFLQEQPDHIELLSEQELRRYHDSQLPNEIPKKELRRPDGYWFITNGNSAKVIALEVEISHKSESDYKSIGHFYNRAETVSQVIWVVQTIGLASRILTSFSQSTLEQRNIHSFILTQDFFTSGWSAQVVAGQNLNQSLFQILDSFSSVNPGSQVGSSVGFSRGFTRAPGHFAKLLSLSRTHKDSSPYKQYACGDFP